ncbi:uncharacterized protein LOC110905326 [Helianthus annuus]|uniref:uncharacterized protein LOC110905326 n=1 Tax=Helianthus annuus TaxID=4232 RepID=UPI000B8F93A1|nr:uncharacterized protein LOC110905326 [Helianthus annuus]
MGDPHEIMEDLPAYSPTNVIPNRFILDESSATHHGSSSSDIWSSDESDEEPLGPACTNDRGKSPLIIPDAHEDDQQGTPRYYVTQTPEGTKFWTPIVDMEFLPVLGKSYETFEEVVAMYKVYGYEAGFNVKQAQTKVCNGCPAHKYLRCSKAAKPQNKRTFDTLCESSAMCSRNSTFTLTDCKARLLIVVTQDPIRFVVHRWNDVHNHPLIDTFNRDLSKFSCSMYFSL